MSTYIPVIGLEIHTELKTKTKMFCYSPNDPDEKHPNINICPICTGHPGTLPFINREAVEKVILTGLALHGEIPEFSQFDRKNYFYPDLPKGYQISQYQFPLVTGGYLDIEVSGLAEVPKFPISAPSPKRLRRVGDNFQFINKSQIQNLNEQVLTKRIRIRRIHLEEDTGRLIHNRIMSSSLVDFNRAGVPLMELVTEPDLHSGEEVKKFGEELQLILRYLGVSDADMEKGQLRVEVNISLAKDGEVAGNKVELKNINSFKFAADAVDYEIKRQHDLLRKGETVKQETRGWDENKKYTFLQRHKEEAYDYRYFPEPDLPPLLISRKWVEEINLRLPELPDAKRQRLAKEYEVGLEAVEILVRDRALAEYFEEVMSEVRQYERSVPFKQLTKLVVNVLTGDFMRLLKKTLSSVTETKISRENFAELVSYLVQNKISNPAAKTVLEEMFRSGEDPSEVIERLGLWQISDQGDLEDIILHILRENPGAVGDYKKGRAASLQFLVGQVMKESRGKANPRIAQEVIRKKLEDISK